MRTNSGGGEARHLLSLDPKTPVSALGKLAQPHLQEEGRGAGGVAWLTDCRAVEAGEDAVSAGEDAAFSRNSQVGSVS